jgi:repressor LexA
MHMTPNAVKILKFIQQFVSQNQYSPTVAEMMDNIHLKSRGTIYHYLKELEAENQIMIKKGKHRNIELVSQLKRESSNESNALNLPLLGKIAAGKPIEAILNHEPINLRKLGGEGKYALKICGDSMIDEGIRDGDLVICRHTNTANNGDIVVALVDNAFATLKRFYLKENKVTLKPENTKFQPVTYNADRITIQGIFLGLLRLPVS